MTPLHIDNFKYSNFDVEHIYNPKLKYIYIRALSPNRISIKTPNKSKSSLLELLKEKSGMIERILQKYRATSMPQIRLAQELMLFGEIHSIDKEEANFLHRRIHRLKTPTKESILRCYDAFYRYQAELYLTQRIDYYANKMHLQYSTLKYRKMKRRWGSCSSMGKITLNTQLLKLKKELIDYVIVHELAHLLYMDHSKAFHLLTQKYLPNAEALRVKLKTIHLS